MAVMMRSRELRGKQPVIFRRDDVPHRQVRIKLEGAPYLYKSLKIKEPAVEKVAVSQGASDWIEALARRAHGVLRVQLEFRHVFCGSAGTLQKREWQ